MNTLYYGDNLDVLRRHIADESVDLIYLDPPFKSNQDYNVLFKEESGERAAAQILAFEDTWHWDEAASRAYEETVLAGGKVADVMRAFHTFLGGNDMLAYLAMMAPRLVELRRVLKPTGSIYLHCDPTASHYLKLLMDAVFGGENLRNEIVWKRAQPKSHTSVRMSRAHDVILFFAKSSAARYRQQYSEHDPEYLEKFYKYVEPKSGRRYRLGDVTNPNKNRPNLKYEFPPKSGVIRVWRWTKDRMMKAWKEGKLEYVKPGAVVQEKRYLDEMEGTPVTDWWDNIEHLHGSQSETLGYPTQKPEALLERIIKASSNEGDVVLDPFCGCGTAVAVAQKLNRQWIGIDITHLAITLIKKRLHDSFGAVKATPLSSPQKEDRFGGKGKATPPSPPRAGGTDKGIPRAGGTDKGIPRAGGKSASAEKKSRVGAPHAAPAPRSAALRALADSGGEPEDLNPRSAEEGGQPHGAVPTLLYRVIGEPTALEDAKQLAEDDKYQFQWWALGLVDARPVEQKKGADQGIDGRRYFIDGKNRRTEQVIFSR